MRLLVGDEWTGDHHEIELMGSAGRVLARIRLPDTMAGIARLHELVGRELGENADGAEVCIGTFSQQGPWLAVLVAAGYAVFPVTRLQAYRYRRRQWLPAAGSSRGDAHTLADMVRTGSCTARAPASGSPQEDSIEALIRMHKTLVWERTRHLQWLRDRQFAC